MTLAALLLVRLLSVEGDVGSDLTRRVDAYVGPYVRSRNFSGAVLIAHGDRVLVRKAYGLANEELGVPNAPETRFHIASVSKSFTAAAVLRLEEQGRLRVQDPLARFVPDYQGGDRITLHHLLAHTSGIRNVNQLPGYDERSRQPWTLEQIVGWFRNEPLEFEPGSRYRYSNSNYNLLAYVVEKASGEVFGEYLRRNVLGPAGLRDTAHHGDAAALVPGRASGYVPTGPDGLENAPFIDWSIKTGNGSLYSTVDDLHRWVLSLRSGKVIGPASLDRMLSDHGDGVGYGWFIRKGPPRSFGLSGRSPGYAASLEHFVDEDLVVVVASNVYSSLTQSMAPDLAAIARGEERRPLLPERPADVPAEVRARYAGRYRFGCDFAFNPGLLAEVRPAGDGLVLVGGGTTYLIPLSAEKFLDRLYGGTVSFRSDPDGRVRSLVWTFGRDYEAIRMVEPTP